MEPDHVIFDKNVREVEELMLKPCHVVLENMDNILQGRKSIFKSELPFWWSSSDGSDEDGKEFLGFDNGSDYSDINIKQEQWQSDNDDNIFEIMNTFSLNGQLEKTVKSEPNTTPIKTFTPTNSFLSGARPAVKSDVLNFVPTLDKLEGFDFGNEDEIQNRKVEPVFPTVAKITSSVDMDTDIHPFVKIFKPSSKTLTASNEFSNKLQILQNANRETLKAILPSTSANDELSVFSSSALDALLDSEVSIKNEPPTLLEGLALQDSAPQRIEEIKSKTFESNLHMQGALNSIKRKLSSTSKVNDESHMAPSFPHLNKVRNEEFNNPLVLQPTVNLSRVRKSLQSQNKTFHNSGSSTLKLQTISNRNNQERAFPSSKNDGNNLLQVINANLAVNSGKAFKSYDNYFNKSSVCSSKNDMFSSVKLRSLKRRSARFNYRELTKVHLPRSSMVKVHYQSPKRRKVDDQFVQKMTSKMANTTVLPMQFEENGALVDKLEPILLKLKKTVVGDSMVHYEHLNSESVDNDMETMSFSSLDSELSNGEEFKGFDETIFTPVDPKIKPVEVVINEKRQRFQVPAEIQAMRRTLKSFHAMSSTAVRSQFYLERSIKYRKKKRALNSYSKLNSLPIEIKLNNKVSKNLVDVSIEKCKLRWTEEKVGNTTVLYPYLYTMPPNGKLICKTEIEKMDINDSCARIRELKQVNGKFTHIFEKDESSGPSIFQHSFDGAHLFSPLNEANLHSISQVCAKSGFILILLQSIKNLEKEYNLVKVLSTCNWEKSKKKIIKALMQCDNDIRKTQRGKFTCSSVDEFSIEMVRSRTMFDVNSSFPWLENKVPEVNQNPTFARISVQHDLNVGGEGSVKIASDPPLVKSMNEILRIDSTGTLFNKKKKFNGVFILEGEQIRDAFHNLVPLDCDDAETKTVNERKTSKKRPRPDNRKHKKFELGTIGCLHKAGLSDASKKAKTDRASEQDDLVFPPEHLRGYSGDRSRKNRADERMCENRIEALKGKLWHQLYVKKEKNSRLVRKNSKIFEEMLNEERFQPPVDCDNRVVPVFQLHGKKPTSSKTTKGKPQRLVNPEDRPCVTTINNKKFIAVPIQKKPKCGKGSSDQCFMLMGPVGKHGVQDVANTKIIQTKGKPIEGDTNKVVPKKKPSVRNISSKAILNPITISASPPTIIATPIINSGPSIATAPTINNNLMCPTTPINVEITQNVKGPPPSKGPATIIATPIINIKSCLSNVNVNVPNKLVVVKQSDAKFNRAKQPTVVTKRNVLIRPKNNDPRAQLNIDISQLSVEKFMARPNAVFKSVTVNRKGDTKCEIKTKQVPLREKLRIIQSKTDPQKAMASSTHASLFKDIENPSKTNIMDDDIFEEISKAEKSAPKYNIFKFMRSPEQQIKQSANISTETVKPQVINTPNDSLDCSVSSDYESNLAQQIKAEVSVQKANNSSTNPIDSSEKILSRRQSLEDSSLNNDEKLAHSPEKDDKMLLQYLNTKTHGSLYKDVELSGSENVDADMLQKTQSNASMLQEKTEKELLSEGDIQSDLKSSNQKLIDSDADEKIATSSTLPTVLNDGDAPEEFININVNSCNSLKQKNQNEFISSSGVVPHDDPELYEITVIDETQENIVDNTMGTTSSGACSFDVQESKQPNTSNSNEASEKIIDDSLENEQEEEANPSASDLTEDELEVVEEEILDVESNFEVTSNMHFHIDSVEELKLVSFDVNDPLVVDFPMEKNSRHRRPVATKTHAVSYVPRKHEDSAVRVFHNTIEKLRRWKLRQAYHNLNKSLIKPLLNYSKVAVIKEAMKVSIYYTYLNKKQELCKQLLLKRNQYLKLKCFYSSRNRFRLHHNTNTAMVDKQIIELLDEKLRQCLPIINQLLKLLALPVYAVVDNVKTEFQGKILHDNLNRGKKDENVYEIPKCPDDTTSNLNTELEDLFCESNIPTMFDKAREMLSIMSDSDLMAISDKSVLDDHQPASFDSTEHEMPSEPNESDLSDHKKPPQEDVSDLNNDIAKPEPIFSGLKILKTQKSVTNKNKPSTSELGKVFLQTGPKAQKESQRKKSKRKQDFCQKYEIDEILVIDD